MIFYIESLVSCCMLISNVGLTFFDENSQGAGQNLQSNPAMSLLLGPLVPFSLGLVCLSPLF